MLYISTPLQIRELEAQLDYYKHHFPAVRDLARENLPPVNGPTSEDRANGGRNANNSQGNPLPLPPRPLWYPFAVRNPNFVPPGNTQSEPSQPYAHQVSCLTNHVENHHADFNVLKDWSGCCLLRGC
jgi:hypothetical protein